MGTITLSRLGLIPAFYIYRFIELPTLIRILTYTVPKPEPREFFTPVPLFGFTSESPVFASSRGVGHSFLSTIAFPPTGIRLIAFFPSYRINPTFGRLIYPVSFRPPIAMARPCNTTLLPSAGPSGDGSAPCSLQFRYFS